MTQNEWTIRAHRFRFEEPDLVMAELIGPVDLEDAKEIVRTISEVGRKQSFYFCGDVGRSTISSQARRYIGENMSEEWLHALIYYGVGPLQRAMGKAILLTMYYAGKVTIDADMFATREEALAYIEKHRQKRAQGEAAGVPGPR